MNSKNIRLAYNIKIKLNEFWYFKRLVDSVHYFYKDSNNIDKTVLLKIPGTGKFVKLDKNKFLKINSSVSKELKIFKNNYNFFMFETEIIRFNKIKIDWDSFRKRDENRKVRIRDAAKILGTSEGEFLSTNIEDGVEYLDRQEYIKNNGMLV